MGLWGRSIKIICLSLVVTFSLALADAQAAAKAKWTVYMYMCGSDLETKVGAASLDIGEALQAELPEDVQVLIQTGGAQQWHNGTVQAKAIERYVHTGAKDALVRLETLPNASMSSPATLQSFLEYGKKNFPSENNIFIFWDHGGGSVVGAIADEYYPGKLMSLQEMKQAFAAVYPSKKGKKPFALVGFDACLMATVDTAQNFAPFADYLVASEEVEPGNGWSYTPWLTALGQDTKMAAVDVGKNICDTYLEGCKAYGTEGAATLSLTDLSALPALQKAYTGLGQEALAKAAQDINTFLPEYGRSAMNAENYGGNTPKTGYTNMVDLGHLAKNTTELLPKHAPQVVAALEKCVVYKVNGPYRNNSHGLSGFYLYGIDAGNLQEYYALDTTPEPFKYLYSYMAAGPDMENTIKEYVGKQANSKSAPRLNTLRSHPLEDAKVDILPDGTAQMSLKPYEAAMLKSVQFMLLNVDRKADTIIVMGSDNNLKADWKKGVFRDNFVGNWGNLDGHFVYMEVLDENEKYTLYSVPLKVNDEQVSMITAYNYDTGKYKILGTRKDVENFGAASKTMTPLKPGDKITTLFYGARLSQPANMVQVDGETFTLSAQPIFSDQDIMSQEEKGAQETFAFVFDMTDLQNNSATSQVVFFTIKDGQITLSDSIE